jgi:hypothetical protein
MQNQRIGQEKHRARSLEQKLGVKSCWPGRSGVVTPWTVMTWVMVLAAGVIALRGAAQIPLVQAAGAPDHESEATLGVTHGERRESGCILLVPHHPLTASGLATPYQLMSANGSACHESTPDTAVFVQAAVLDPATGQISIYDPLVIDQGTRAAAQPVLPKLPANAVVGIWFGSNGSNLHLQGADSSTLHSAQCVDGLGRSVFGQVAYCHAPAFFAMANRLIQAGKLTPPPLGTAIDGMTCPSVRDFSVVDQDPSDNVTTSYRITQDGSLAQDTAANRALFPESVAFGNGSDNRLLAIALDGALGCAPWEAPDLADPGQMVTAQPLNELQAAMYQAAPIAYVPSVDPMTLVNGQPSLPKQNLYRAGVDQPQEPSAMQASADQLSFCRDVLSIAPSRIEADKAWTVSAASPDTAVANSLFTFLAARLSVTIGPGGLHCTSLLNVASPVQLTQANGVVVDASFSASTTANQSDVTIATGFTTPMKGA